MEEENKTNVTKNKKGLMVSIVAIIILLAIVGGAIYYFTIYTKPEELFKRTIGNSLKSYESSIEKNDYKSINTKMGVNVKVTPNEEDEDSKEILDLINDLEIVLNVQMDNEKKQLLTKVESKYEDQNLLNLDIFADVEKKETYASVKDIFDKYIEVKMDDESYKTLEELFENTYTKDQKVNLQKAFKIMNEEFKKVIKTEYCNSEEQEITIDNKTVKTNKNTITMTYNQLCDEIITVCTNLKNNKEFTDCYKDSQNIIDTLQNVIEEIEDEKDSYNDVTIKISVYTTGILQNIEKVDIEVQDKKNAVTIEINKKDKENYEFKISDGKQEINGKINIKKESDNNTKYKIEIDIPEFGKVELNLDVNCEVNKEIEKVDTSNSIKPEEFTESDYKAVLKNLEKSKLYELIEKYTGNVLKNEMTDKKDDDNKIDIDEEEPKETKTEDNVIITYDNDQKIEFKIPEGYENSYNTDNYKAFEKEDISIKLTTQNGDIDEYFEDVEDTKTYYEDKEDNDYKDVKLSDIKTMDVEGREFKYQTLEYKYESVGKTYNYRNMYICSKISNKNIVVVEVKDFGEMEEAELRQILTMKVIDM